MAVLQKLQAAVHRWRQRRLAVRVKRRIEEARKEMERCSICGSKDHIRFACQRYVPEHAYVGHRCINCGLDIDEILSLRCEPSRP